MHNTISTYNRMFQFLIGSMKDAQGEGHPVGVCMFQFLIGSMKARSNSTWFFKFVVSIPYRFNESYLAYIVDCQGRRFNSL
ncbi:hypothetical protein BROSI_A0327 [Candidatus Brocadia sinica JPN1]|uniref:Uncharacterized protein n=1 Tax=Candidatus Brocadia sinica JPN1 TaxID=1197129 RepID=A0ABQ0JSX4_9BACT|nr:hypothetical protein BROSI_A0327 [Candidatus Brocadia sinica JPN1]